MQDIPIKIKVVVMTIIIMGVMLSCTFTSRSNNDEGVEELKEQVNMLSTQNAKLMEKTDTTESVTNDVQAPNPPDEIVPDINIASPTSESLPPGPVSAGVPIIYDGWSLTVSEELTIISHKDAWGITLYVRNTEDTKRIFRFKNAGITATDDLGNVYKYDSRSSVAGLGSGTCEERLHYVKNLEISAGESETIRSGSSGYSNCWLEDGINMFEGPIPLNATQLIIHFEDFGPYRGIDVVIDL